MSGSDRRAALDTLEAALASLPASNRASNTQQLVQTVKALPQFTNAGSSADGTVWGEFKGGMLLLIVPVAPPGGDNVATTPAPTVQPPAAPSVERRAAAPSSLAGTVPVSERVRLFNGLGNFFSSEDARPTILGMLQANGYTGTIDEATVANLRTVSGDGVFYIRTHGGLGHGNGSDLYALWTSTEVLDPDAETKDAALLEDLSKQRVVYMLFRNEYWNQNWPDVFKDNRHYGITSNFVSHYMSFADHGLVYIDACNGADYAGDPSFRDSFKNKNASVFVGWNERVKIGLAGETAKYVFDRLLGANKFAPESPKQRPFVYQALNRDPKFGMGKQYGYSTAVLRDGKTSIVATLDFYPLVGQFGMLAPSIFALHVDEIGDQLILFGSFGPDPGGPNRTVTIDDGSGGTALAVTNWITDGSAITTGLPRTGGGSSGDVVVTVRGHQSNTRQVLAWDGTFRHSIRSAGTLTQRFELDVRMRADPHDMRDDPGAAPHPTPDTLVLANSAVSARFEASGTFTQTSSGCTLTTAWTGSGSIPASSGVGLQSYVYSGLLDKQAGMAQLAARASHRQGGVDTETHDCPPPVGKMTFTSKLGVLTAFEPFYSSGAEFLKLPIDASLSIAGGSRQIPQSPGELTLDWGAISPKPAYDGNLPR